MERVGILTLTIAASCTGFLSTSEASSAQGTRPADRRLAETIRSCVARMSEDDRFSGVFYVEKDGQPLLEFSRAAKGSGPFTMDTPFNVASAAKMFTAVAIGQLVDQGKLRFDARLGDILKELPPELAKVRIDQALSHTGGVRGMTQLTPELGARIRKAANVRELVPLIAEEGLSFEPGTKTEYSNGGFVLLGAVVETVSGISFTDYVARNVISKAKMKNTQPVEPPQAAARLSRMTPGAPPGERARTRMGSATPAGGWYSSARDLARFARALREHQLVTPATSELLLSISSTTGSRATAGKSEERRGYGFGFGINQTNTDKIVGHNGGAPGSNAEVWTSLRNGWTAVALSNIDPPAATNAMQFARQVLVSGAGTTAECERFSSARGPFDGSADRSSSSVGQASRASPASRAQQLTPQKPDAAEGELLLAERHWLDAYERRNAAAMESILASEFVISYPDGRTMDKAAVMAQLRQGAGQPQVRFSTQSTKVQISGDKATLSGIFVMQSSRGTRRSRYTDVWVRRDGRWQVIASRLSGL